MDHLKSYTSKGIEIGFTVYEPYRRKGYASEAVTGFMNWLSTHDEDASVVLSINTGNVPSLGLAEKLRFKPIDEVQDGEETERVFIHK
jgi:[ribosomal protein S5]-alanine N-acetyltransferase